MSIDSTNWSAYFKATYPANVVEEMFYKDRIALKLLKRNNKAGGANTTYPITYANNQGISADPKVAFNATGNSKSVQAVVTYKELYERGTINVAVWERSQGDKNAFADALDYELRRVIDSMANDINRQLLANGDGVIGNIKGGSSLAQAAITLATPEDAARFEVGMDIVCSETGSSTNRVSSARVTGVDRNAGTVSFSTFLTGTITAAYAGVAGGLGDALIRSGNVGTAEIAGFGQWLPSSNPSSGESFYGMDRSVDTRLYGARFDAAGGTSVREALIEGTRYVTQLGGNPDTAFINPLAWSRLARELESLRLYSGDSSKGNVGFESLVVNGYRGPLKVYADPFVKSSTAFLLKMDTWEFLSVKEAPHVQEFDGRVIFPVAGDNLMEFRVAFQGNLRCLSPLNNGRIINLGL